MEKYIGLPIETVVKALSNLSKKIIVMDNASMLEKSDRESVVKIEEAETTIKIITSRFLFGIKE